MHSTLHDEYQDGRSTGSLARAHAHWIELRTASALTLPQQFSFSFTCPSPGMAQGLKDFLGHAPYAGQVGTDDGTSSEPVTWQVAGITLPKLYSLSCLEQLFMGLRWAAAHHESTLIALDLLPTQAGSTSGS